LNQTKRMAFSSGVFSIGITWFLTLGIIVQLGFKEVVLS